MAKRPISAPRPLPNFVVISAKAQVPAALAQFMDTVLQAGYFRRGWLPCLSIPCFPGSAYTGTMAMQRTWLSRGEEIIAVLRQMKSPDLDRAAIQELFQLQRRMAILLMKQVGATGDRGSSFLVQRSALLKWVERVFRDESWQLDRLNTTREELSRSMTEVRALREALQSAGKPVVTFPVVDEMLRSSLSSLPSLIIVEPGRIVVEVPERDASIACQRLYNLALAIANDLEGFEDGIRGASAGDTPAADSNTNTNEDHAIESSLDLEAVYSDAI